MFSINKRNDEEFQQLDRFNLLPDGEYELTIKNVEEKISASLNPMLKILLSTNEGAGIFDYLVTVTLKDKDSYPSEKEYEKAVKAQLFMDYKTKKFMDAFGIPYLEKLNPDTLVDLKGKGFIITQKGAKKDDGTFYPDKNSVKDYVKKEDSNIAHPADERPQDDFNDSIPF